MTQFKTLSVNNECAINDLVILHRHMSEFDILLGFIMRIPLQRKKIPLHRSVLDSTINSTPVLKDRCFCFRDKRNNCCLLLFFYNHENRLKTGSTVKLWVFKSIFQSNKDLNKLQLIFPSVKIVKKTTRVSLTLWDPT